MCTVLRRCQVLFHMLSTQELSMYSAYKVLGATPHAVRMETDFTFLVIL